MKDFVYYNELFEIYSSLLTEKEKETFKDYYCEDLSLSEIADNKNISRAAVQKTVSNVIDKLNYYENILKINKNNKTLKECLDLNDISSIKNKINDILDK
ncbi:MAG: hypothetical protein IKX00_01770 [Bacilli bacterium]|nr:hypothetical protein [Bacilli bacterium]